MSQTSIEVQVMAGADIAEVAIETVRLSQMLGIDVRFMFSGFSIRVKPHDGPPEVVSRFSKSHAAYCNQAEEPVVETESEWPPDDDEEEPETAPKEPTRWLKLCAFCDTIGGFQSRPGTTGEESMVNFVRDLAQEQTDYMKEKYGRD